MSTKGLSASWQYRLARKIVHLRIYIILSCVVVTVFFISVLKDIKVETHLQDFLPQRHHFIKVQHRLTNVFGGLNQVSIALKVKEGDMFNKKFIDKIISLTEDLYLVDGVNIARVNSIASRHVKYVIANSHGFFVNRLLRAPPEDKKGMEELKKRAEVAILGEDRVDLRLLMDYLWKKGVRKLMVEGGGRVISSFLKERLVDQIFVYTGGVVFGEGVSIAEGKISPHVKLELLEVRKLGRGVLTRWRVLTE